MHKKQKNKTKTTTNKQQQQQQQQASKKQTNKNKAMRTLKTCGFESPGLIQLCKRFWVGL